MSSPTQLSLKLLRKQGYECAITERWNPFAKIRQDLFGFCDILCLGDGIIIAVQTTVLGSVQKRIDKILAEPRAIKFIKAGGLIYVHGWAKKGSRGQKKVQTCRIFQIPPTGRNWTDITL